MKKTKYLMKCKDIRESKNQKRDHSQQNGQLMIST